jgi:hypothetical protein
MEQVAKQADLKRVELFRRLTVLKKQLIKSVNDSLEMNDIQTKLKCLHALLQRIKLGPS